MGQDKLMDLTHHRFSCGRWLRHSQGLCPGSTRSLVAQAILSFFGTWLFSMRHQTPWYNSARATKLRTKRHQAPNHLGGQEPAPSLGATKLRISVDKFSRQCVRRATVESCQEAHR